MNPFFAKTAYALRRLGQGIAALIMIAVLIPTLTVALLFAPGPLAEAKTIIIARGAAAGDIAAQLGREDVVYLSVLFRLAARLVASGSLKAGEYAIPAHASPVDISS